MREPAIELSLEIISVPVSDQNRSLRFYSSMLGFEVVEDVTFERVRGERARWVQMRVFHGPSITLVTWVPSMSPGSLKGLVLETPRLGPTMAALASRGLAFSHEPVEAPWATFTSFDDPDANGWVLQQPH